MHILEASGNNKEGAVVSAPTASEDRITDPDRTENLLDISIDSQPDSDSEVSSSSDSESSDSSDSRTLSLSKPLTSTSGDASIHPTSDESSANNRNTLCAACQLVVPKYKCPACLVASCSLACVKQHKEKTGCTGIKAPVSVKMDDDVLHADYRFLENVRSRIERNLLDHKLHHLEDEAPLPKRLKQNDQRKQKDDKPVVIMKPRNSNSGQGKEEEQQEPKPTIAFSIPNYSVKHSRVTWENGVDPFRYDLPNIFKRLRYEARQRGVQLAFMPRGMSRRNVNRSYYVPKIKTIRWHVRVQFLQADVDVEDIADENISIGRLVASHLHVPLHFMRHFVMAKGGGDSSNTSGDIGNINDDIALVGGDGGRDNGVSNKLPVNDSVVGSGYYGYVEQGVCGDEGVAEQDHHDPYSKINQRTNHSSVSNSSALVYSHPDVGGFRNKWCTARSSNSSSKPSGIISEKTLALSQSSENSLVNNYNGTATNVSNLRSLMIRCSSSNVNKLSTAVPQAPASRPLDESLADPDPMECSSIPSLVTDLTPPTVVDFTLLPLTHDQKQQMLLYQSAGIGELAVLCKNENFSEPARRYVLLDTSDSLKDSLAGLRIVEYPQLIVVRKDHAYEFISDEQRDCLDPELQRVLRSNQRARSDAPAAAGGGRGDGNGKSGGVCKYFYADSDDEAEQRDTIEDYGFNGHQN